MLEGSDLALTVLCYPTHMVWLIKESVEEKRVRVE